MEDTIKQDKHTLAIWRGTYGRYERPAIYFMKIYDDGSHDPTHQYMEVYDLNQKGGFGEFWDHIDHYVKSDKWDIKILKDWRDLWQVDKDENGKALEPPS
tara:strand:+ start:153 stop:452 length:300 start_codon:yes stop_codon:yes gene_type:complete